MIMSDVQAFTRVPVRNSGRDGGAFCGGYSSSSTRPSRASRDAASVASTSTCLGCRMRKVARVGAMRMSEMTEDYPSDTGDDRFAGSGE